MPYCWTPLVLRARYARQSAFTLIEMLLVVAIIGILAAITLGVSRGVQERAAINQARSELAVLATALEAYKRQYGDYPRTGVQTGNTPPSTATASSVQGRFFNAMAGKLGPRLAEIEGRSFVEISKIQVANPSLLPALTGTISVDNHFIDPWGRAYIYSYRPVSGGSWTNPTYVLFSAGPDGRFNLPANGLIDRNHADNLDNVFSN